MHSARLSQQSTDSHAGPSDDPTAFNGRLYKTWEQSLIVSILSAGTFFGALFAGSLADWLGRRSTIMLGCGVFAIGVILQVASTTVALLVPGRLVAGIGIGFVSAIIILYMSEIAPKAVRGAIVSGMFSSDICFLHAYCSKATSSASPLAFFWLPSLTMPPRTAWTLVLTASPCPCSGSSPSFSALDFSSCPTLLAGTSSATASTMLLARSASFAVNLPTRST